MKRLKRIISICLVICLLICEIPVYAAEEETYSIAITMEDKHRYERYDLSMTWNEAEAYCKNLGGHLVTITSEEEQNTVSNLFGDNTQLDYYWMGLYYVDTQWKWITEEPMTYTNWSTGEPNNYQSSEYVGHIYGKQIVDGGITKYIGEWNDMAGEPMDSTSALYSKSKFGFICEYESPVYTGQYNNNQYMIFDNATTWEQAEQYCETIGGHLATITSAEEQSFIETMLLEAGNKNQYWLGAKRVGNSFQWITSETFSYSKWDYAQPDNHDSNESYLQILNKANPFLSSSGRFCWNDMNNLNYISDEASFFSTDYIGFICEFEDSSTDDSAFVSNFNEYIYRAAFITDTASVSDVDHGIELQKITELSYIKTPGKALKEAAVESEYEEAAAVWNGFKASIASLDNPTKAASIILNLEQKDLYAAIIMDAFRVSVENYGKDKAEDFLNSIKDFTDIIKEAMKGMANVELMDATFLNQLEKEDLTKLYSITDDQLKNTFPNFAELSSCTDIIFKYGEIKLDLITYCENIYAFAMMYTMTESMKEVLYEMYLEAPNNSSLKTALEGCVQIVASSQEEFIEKAVTGQAALVAGKHALEIGIGALWNSMMTVIQAANPTVASILVGLKSGMFINEVLFSTSATQGKYFELLAIIETEDLADQVINTMKERFKDSRSEFDAMTFLDAVSIRYALLDRECKASYEYANIVDSAAAGLFLELLGVDVAGEAENRIKELQDSYKDDFQYISTNWITALQQEHPTLYDVYKGRLETNNDISVLYTIACPVDVFVYDKEGTLAGSVSQNVPNANEDIFVMVENNVKTVYLRDNSQYTIKCVGNDEGTMDIRMDFYEGDEKVRYSQFYDLPLETDRTYELQSVDNPMETDEFVIESLDDGTISADFDSDDSSENQHLLTVNNGYVNTDLGALTETNGSLNESLTINAVVPNGYRFAGWKIESGDAVLENASQTSTVLRFGQEDTVVTALLKEIAAGTCGDNVTWIIDENGVMTISGTGAMTDYTVAYGPWHDYRESIVEVIIEEGVTTIGQSAFHGFTNLAKIVIPDGITKVGYGAFKECSSLTEIILPSSVTDIGKYAFTSCSSLEEMVIPEGITNIKNGTFSGCSNLKSVILPSTITYFEDDVFSGCSSLVNIVFPENITDLGNYTFSDCSSLVELVIPDRITKIGKYLFEGCSGLTSITLPSQLKSIGEGAFYDCTSLRECSIPTSVTQIGGFAFRKCTSLEEIVIPDSISVIEDYLFYNCSGLKAITMPDTITEIGTYAFYYCTELKDMVLPDGVITIADSAFKGCTSIENIRLGEKLQELGKYAFDGCSALTSVTIPKNIVSIGNFAFQSCKKLKKVIISEGVVEIGERAFSYCNALDDVVIPASVVSIGKGAFQSDGDLEKIFFLGDAPTFADEVFQYNNTEAYYPANNTTWTTEVMQNYAGNVTWIPCYTGTCGSNVYWRLEENGTLFILGEGAMTNYTYKSEMPWYPYLNQITSVVVEEGVTNIGYYAFYGMTNLKSILIADSVTSIGNYAFKNSTLLDGVLLPSNLTKLGESAFYGCTGLTSIEIPASLWTVQPYTFKNCTSLAELTFHEGNLQKISDGAFYNTALTELVLPDCLDILDVYAFKNCTSLASITLGNSLTELREAVFYGTAISTINIPEGITKVGPYAFKNCVNLETVDFPESLKNIGEASFYACTELKAVDLPNAVTTIGNYAFRKCAAIETLTFGSELTIIGECSFYGCTGLTELIIPDKVTIIKPYAFKTCTGLTSVTLGNAVETIGEGAFNTCTGLKTLVFPASVKTIGDYCFSGSYNLWKLTFKGNAPAIGTGAFKGMDATAYYPSDDVTWTAEKMQNYGGKITWKDNK